MVLELARVMSQYHFRKTIVFIAFAGEELGFVGSTRYASRAKANHEQIEAVFNNDIVGSDVTGEPSSGTGIALNDIGGADDDTGGSGETGNRLRVYSPEPADSPSRRLARYIKDAAQRYVPSLQIELILRSDRYTRGGDQIPFQQNGFAAVRLTSASENLISQHTTGRHARQSLALLHCQRGARQRGGNRQSRGPGSPAVIEQFCSIAMIAVAPAMNAEINSELYSTLPGPVTRLSDSGVNSRRSA